MLQKCPKMTCTGCLPAVARVGGLRHCFCGDLLCVTEQGLSHLGMIAVGSDFVASIEDKGGRGGKDGFGGKNQLGEKSWSNLHQNAGVTLLVGPAAGWLQPSIYQNLVSGSPVTNKSGGEKGGGKE